MSVEWEQRGGNVTETGETVEAEAFRIAFCEAIGRLADLGISKTRQYWGMSGAEIRV